MSPIAPTIGASFSTFKIKLDDGSKVKLQIWVTEQPTAIYVKCKTKFKLCLLFKDTAGQEKFKAMAPLYYRHASSALLVFDLTNYNTFLEVKKWVQELHK